MSGISRLLWVTVTCAMGLAGPPKAEAQSEQVKHGLYIFDIGGCASCHTKENGKPLAGGDPIKSPFGTFYAPNITPDPQYGIGSWTDVQFAAALREGVRPDGTHLYPALPYTSYTLITDEDVKALWAYIQTVPPVSEPAPANQLQFPYNQRWALGVWQWLFFKPQRFVPDPSKDASWNRGAYLVNGPGHCQECHTPRTLMGARDTGAAFRGSTLGQAERPAPNITHAKVWGTGDWTHEQMNHFLETGQKPDGDIVKKGMGLIVEHGTSNLTQEDRDAMIDFLFSLSP